MTNYNDYQRVVQLQELAAQMKLVIGNGYMQSMMSNNETIGLYTPDSNDEQSWALYSRHVLLFRGTVEECIGFLMGIQSYKKYVGMLGFEKKIAVAEEKYYDKLQIGRLMDAVTNGKDGGIDEQRKKNTTVA